MFAAIIVPSVQGFHRWKQMGMMPLIIVLVLHDAPQINCCPGLGMSRMERFLFEHWSLGAAETAEKLRREL
jgi:hypothetical protein